MKLKSMWQLLRATFSEFSKDNVLRLSAALAYYSLFSVAPLLAIAVGVAGLAFNPDTVRGQLQQLLQQLLGESAAKTISSMMAARSYSGSPLATALGISILLIAASGVFGELHDSLNAVWGVKPRKGAGLWQFIRTRFLSFTMVLGVGFLLLVSMALSTFLTAVTGWMGDALPLSGAFAILLSFFVSLGVITLLFAMIFKVLPDVRIPFRKVWVGALGTALLFNMGKFLLALYLGRVSTASTYGAAGSVAIVLMWFYYASVILFFGAEFTQVYARRTGANVEPKRFAVPLAPDQARATQ